jgi:CheY-like chemotaxis protein
VSTDSRGRVVVVNDDPQVLALYREVLSELQYEPVAMMTEGVETDRIRDASPDAVILDLQVGEHPEYGVEMAKELRQDLQFAAIPIVVCTANAGALEGARQTLSELDVPVVLKPFSVEQLGALLSGSPGP